MKARTYFVLKHKSFQFHSSGQGSHRKSARRQVETGNGARFRSEHRPLRTSGVLDDYIEVSKYWLPTASKGDWSCILFKEVLSRTVTMLETLQRHKGKALKTFTVIDRWIVFKKVGNTYIRRCKKLNWWKLGIFLRVINYVVLDNFPSYC